MAFVTAISSCLGCKRPFSYHPNLVPSFFALNGRPVAVGTPGATKEPVCETCLAKINAARHAKGLEPFVAPQGAYEPAEESAINWS